MDYCREGLNFFKVAKECGDIARSHGAKVASISMEWSGRFSRRMGDARVTDRLARCGLVRLSRTLWPLATESKRRNTMIHEIAHIYAELERPGAGHGHVWAKWMRRFGERAERCYSLNAESFSDVAAVKAKRLANRYHGTCPRCGRTFNMAKATRTRWINRGQSRRHRCGQVLTVEWARNMRLGG